MCKIISVFPSLEADKNKTIVKKLQTIGSGIEIEYVRDFGILDDVAELPFIKTDEGECFFGVDSITKFVGNLKAKL